MTIYILKFNFNLIHKYFKKEKNMIIWLIKLKNSTDKIKIVLQMYKLEFKSLKNNKL